MNVVADRHQALPCTPFMHLPGVAATLQPGRGARVADGEPLHSDDEAAMCRATVSDEGGALVARATDSFHHLDLR